MASEIKVDTISEKTSANGVTIDGVNIKDSALATAGSVPLSTIDIDGGTDIGAAIVDADLFIIDDGAGGTNRKTTASRLKTYAGTTINNATVNEVVTIASTTTELDAEAKLLFAPPKLTIGNATAEDTLIVFDGNAKDFYIALDDSADKLVIGDGSTAGTNSILTLTDDSVTIGDAAAVDTKIVFDGNAQDFYVGLDDSADDLIIGVGSSVGSNPAIAITEDKNVTLGATEVSCAIAGITFYSFGGTSMYTHDVSSTDSNAENNTAYGFGALDAVTTGDYNICIGGGAGGAIDTGATNLFVGHGAGDGFDAETFNMGIGFDALGGAVNGGEYNCAIGHYVMDNLTSGDKNTAVGYNAGGSITTGDKNTIIGYANFNVAAGSNCIAIGVENGMNPTSSDDAIVLGNSITGVSNDFQFGKASNIVSNDFDADADWSRSSDERIKRNIEDSTLGLDFINDLRPVKFQWKPSYEIPKELTNEYNEENQKNLDVIMHGFIAQNVKEAMDRHGDTTFGGWHLDKVDGVTQRTKKNMFIMPLVNAVKELSSQITTLQEEVKTLKGE